MKTYVRLGSLLLLLFFCASTLWAMQSGKEEDFLTKADSLLTVLYEQADSPKKASLLNDIAWANKKARPHLSLKLAKQSLQLSEVLNFDTGIANSHHTLGMVYWYQSEYELASSHFYEALKIRERIGDAVGLARSYNNIGNIYFRQANLTKAEDFYSRSLQLRLQLKDSVGLVYSYNNLADVYTQQQRSTKALEFYQHALSIAEQLDSKEAKAFVYGHLGGFYLQQKAYLASL